MYYAYSMISMRDSPSTQMSVICFDLVVMKLQATELREAREPFRSAGHVPTRLRFYLLNPSWQFSTRDGLEPRLRPLIDLIESRSLTLRSTNPSFGTRSSSRQLQQDHQQQ